MAVLFWFFNVPYPKHEQRKLKKQFITIGQQLAPLTEARVWRFGLALWRSLRLRRFRFALALWLPKYYMQEYGRT